MHALTQNYQAMRSFQFYILGRLMAEKYQRQSRESGTAQAARNMRKQGVPLAAALIVLVGRV